jgi:NADPH2:quinone reductase
MKALTFSSFGNSDVLEYKEINNPVLKEDEILVEMKAIGLNFADLMRRNGNYSIRGNLPYINGYEGAGIVSDNNNHSDYKPGDRVAFADVPLSNAELVAVPVTHAIPLPSDISFETAASVLLQGLTAQYLTSDSHKIKCGEWAVIHTSAGGVGQLLIQICKLLGARVISLASSEDKKDICLSLGAEVALLYKEDWKSKVLKICPDGVDVVFDSIGTTIGDSLAVTKTFGQVVFFGLSGGRFDVGNPLDLMGQSRTITGGDLWNYLISKQERIKRSTQLFEWIRTYQLRVSDPAKFRLSEGKKAYDLMESRKSTGKIIMIP